MMKTGTRLIKVFILLVYGVLSGAKMYDIGQEPQSHRELAFPPAVEGFEFITWIEFHPDYPGKWMWLSTKEEKRENMEYACHNMGMEFDEMQVVFYNHLKFYLECAKHNDDPEMVTKMEQATINLLNSISPKKTIWSGHFDMTQDDEDKRCMVYQWNEEKQSYEEGAAPSCNDNYVGLCSGEPQH